ncbi:MAG TPA: hypothetical protein VN256_08215 [Pyrinomonadaceae bacterium]|nr:hypothetical protein [Pyrinomonadaceae bacterium]
MSEDFQFEALERWPYAKPSGRRATFKANYSKTLAQLRAELTRAGARRPIIQTGHRGEDIRFDGLPKANARTPRFPGVCLIFEKWKPIGRKNEQGQPLGVYETLEFPCATYSHWEDNLRAIVLTLEALRAVARYGVAGTGAEAAGKTEEAKQYSGFARKKISDEGAHHDGRQELTPEAAASILAACAEGGWTVQSVLSGRAEMEACFKAAAKKSHPDAGGTDNAFVAVSQAVTVLRAHFNGN